MDDANVREEALDPTRSFIVEAPAGSGKTSLLMQRFLVLLGTVQVPEECLAITFTRKAAVEMRNRILDALIQAQNPCASEEPYILKTWLLAKKVLERSKVLDWDLLYNPNRLRIQTIDSLCASLTRGMPILSRLGASPEVATEPRALYWKAAKDLLEALETEDPWSLPLRSLMIHLDNNLSLAQRLLADLLPYRDQWLPYIGRTMSPLEWRHILEQGLKTAIQESVYVLKEVFPEALISPLRELALFASKQMSYSDPQSAIGGIQYAENESTPYYFGLAELLLTEEGEWRKTVTHKQGFPAPRSAINKNDKLHFQQNKNNMLELLRQLEIYPEFKARLFALKNCPPSAYTEEEWSVVASLIQILPVLSAHLNMVFQEQGKVDFTEVMMAANRALGDLDAPTDLALVLDNKIRHLLVDEFQDTSIAQFELLKKLTVGWMRDDGRTLFFVGDPMQSIYRFRQAEVGLFLAVKQQGIHEIPLHPLTLTVNFRSDPKIIQGLNDLFMQTFPKEDNISSGAIRFTASVAHRFMEPNSEFAMIGFLEKKKEIEAQYVIQYIQKAKTLDPEGSIAILVRSRTQLSHILPALRAAGIVYQGIDLELLANKPIIQDLNALTQALLHQGDRLAWLSICRCPWINLSLSDILILSQKADNGPIWGALNGYMGLDTLSFRAKETLAHCVPILKEALFNRDRVSIRTFIWDTWIALKGHEWLYDAGSKEDADMFFDTLDKLEQQGTIQDPEALKAEINSLYAKSTVTDPKAVQIMTIHKSKGLEFDTVILPGLGRAPRASPSSLLLWEERASRNAQQYLIFAPIQAVGGSTDAIYCYLKQQKQKAESFEALRLLYVAGTRAKKRLYWMGDREPLPNSLLSLVWNAAEPHLMSIDPSDALEMECV